MVIWSYGKRLNACYICKIYKYKYYTRIQSGMEPPICGAESRAVSVYVMSRLLRAGSRSWARARRRARPRRAGRRRARSRA